MTINDRKLFEITNKEKESTEGDIQPGLKPGQMFLTISKDSIIQGKPQPNHYYPVNTLVMSYKVQQRTCSKLPIMTGIFDAEGETGKPPLYLQNDPAPIAAIS